MDFSEPNFKGVYGATINPLRLVYMMGTIWFLNNESLDRTTLIQTMIDNPILIERPIVAANGRVRLGRPPIKVLEILN